MQYAFSNVYSIQAGMILRRFVNSIHNSTHYCTVCVLSVNVCSFHLVRHEMLLAAFSSKLINCLSQLTILYFVVS